MTALIKDSRLARRYLNILVYQIVIANKTATGNAVLFITVSRQRKGTADQAPGARGMLRPERFGPPTPGSSP
jgi:hypothetical protein